MVQKRVTAQGVGVDARRATPPDPRPPRWGSPAIATSTPAPAIVTCEGSDFEPCPSPPLRRQLLGRTRIESAVTWGDENSVLHKLRFPPDFVAPFSLCCAGGSPFFPPLRRVAGGVDPARPVTGASHALFLSVLSHHSREARRIGLELQGSRITPPTPPSQGGERGSHASSFQRAQQKHASRNRPFSSVNTHFSSPHPSPLPREREPVTMYRPLECCGGAHGLPGRCQKTPFL
jgi:hypothetical protein